MNQLFSTCKRLAKACAANIKQRYRTMGAVVVNFHNVGPDSLYTRHLPITMKPEDFEERVAFLKAHFHVTPYSALIKDHLNVNLAAITFDDGYRSFLEHALPIIEKYQCPVKLFLNSQQVFGELNWLNKLSAIFTRLSESELRNFLMEAAPGWHRNGVVSIIQLRAHFSFPKTLTVIDKTFAGLPNLPAWHHTYLSRDDVLHLANHPLLEWGSHTYQHLPFERLTPADQEREILKGHHDLFEILGDRLSGIALPFGKATLRKRSIARLVEKVDTVLATATGERIYRKKIGNLFEIQRLCGEGQLEHLRHQSV